MTYEPDVPEVKAWLNAGGYEIAIETVRRMGWPVEVSDEWPDDSNEIAISSLVKGWERTSVNAKKSGYEQAVAVVAAFQDVHSYISSHEYSPQRYRYPVFMDGDDSKMDPWDIRSIIEFCDIVRRSSEASERKGVTHETVESVSAGRGVHDGE